MEQASKKIFNVSVLGASHLKDGKPCQDYSLSWQSDDADVSIVIVCDGHGSDTYVRSDVGSRLAATIAFSAIKTMVIGDPERGISPNPEWILNSSGSVTAREQNAALRYDTRKPKPENEMTEVDTQRYNQRLSFISQVRDIREQDEIFEALFTTIYEKWIDAINLDANENPFSEIEKSKLAGNKLVKAYGTTLMAYVQTPLYWFAFHIGDGRLLGCDRELNWKQLVPWDCACFQNHTTSLCNSQPVPLFRYAFDATGNFPAAVFCCSDGIEDSWGDYDVAPQLLHSYYTNLLGVFAVEDTDSVVAKLDDFLPKLSEKGSKDDMSLAGIIDTEAIQEGLKRREILDSRNQIEEEINARAEACRQIEEEIESKKTEIQVLRNTLSQKEEEKANADSIAEKEIDKLDREISEVTDRMNNAIKLAIDGWKRKMNDIFSPLKNKNIE